MLGARNAKSSLLSALALESFVAPVKPPKNEMFSDLRPVGRYYDTPCELPRMEERAIMLSQLAKLRGHIERRCKKEAWQSSAPTHVSLSEADMNLTPATVTHYDVCAYVLKPCTFFHRCSFVEKITEEPGPKRPDYFLSHWCLRCYILERHPNALPP